MLGILDKHGCKYAVPEGAYYVMADFRHLGRGDDDMAFARWLIDEVGVATVPGSSFYASSLLWAAVWCVSPFRKRTKRSTPLKNDLRNYRPDDGESGPASPPGLCERGEARQSVD